MPRIFIIFLSLCGILVSCEFRNLLYDLRDKSNPPYKEITPDDLSRQSMLKVNDELFERLIASLTLQQREELAELIVKTVEWSYEGNRLFRGIQVDIDTAVQRQVNRQCKDTDIKRIASSLAWEQMFNSIEICEFVIRHYLANHPDEYHGWNMIYFYMLSKWDSSGRNAAYLFNIIKKYDLHRTKHGEIAGRLANALKKGSFNEHYNSISCRHAEYENFTKTLPDFTEEREDYFKNFTEVHKEKLEFHPCPSWLFKIRPGFYPEQFEWMIYDERAPLAYRDLSTAKKKHLAELIVRSRDWQLDFIEEGCKPADQVDKTQYNLVISYIRTHCKDKDILRIFTDPEITDFFRDNSVIIADIVCRYYLSDHPEDVQAWEMLKYFSLIYRRSNGYIHHDPIDSLLRSTDCYGSNYGEKTGIEYIIFRNKLTKFRYGREILFLTKGQVLPLTWETFLFPETIKRDERTCPNSCYYISATFSEGESLKFSLSPRAVSLLRKAVANKNNLRERTEPLGLWNFGSFVINGEDYEWRGRSAIYPVAHPGYEISLPSIFALKKKEHDEIDSYGGMDKHLRGLYRRFFERL